MAFLDENGLAYFYGKIKGQFTKVIKITDDTTTLGDVNTILNGTGGVNPSGYHVFFDLSVLGMMQICTIEIDTENGKYKVFDLISGLLAEGTYNAATLLTSAISGASQVETQSRLNALGLSVVDGKVCQTYNI